MRIAFVVHEYNRRFGHSRYVVELAERFAREHDVHVYANRADAPATANITVHHVPAVRANALSTILSFIPMAAMRVGDRYDIVHAQGLVTSRADVVTAHICLASWFRAQREQTVGRSLRQRVFELVLTPMERAFYRHAARAWVIAISEALRGELRTHYGRTERVDVIHHGVDLDTFAPPSAAARDAARQAVSLARDEIVALYVGDLRKGGARAIDVVAAVPGVILALVSRSDDAEYRAYAASRGVADRVRFWPPSDMVHRYYAAADVFLFPTPYDAFGMVITEAMATGLPVITTARAGAAELIVHGESGFVVADAGDVDAMSQQLRALVGQPEQRRRIGAAAREAVEHHSWDEVARRTLAIYEKARQRRSG